MREIRQSGSVGGVGSSIPIPTPIEPCHRVPRWKFRIQLPNRG